MEERRSLEREIADYKERLSRHPQSLIFAPLADSYRKNGQLDEAITLCLKGLELHPNYMSARVVLGKAYLEKGMVKEAITEFSKVIEAVPENLVAHTMLGEAHKKLGRYTQAIEEYEKVLTLNPSDINARASLEELKRLLKEAQATEEVTTKEEVPSGLLLTELDSKKEVPPPHEVLLEPKAFSDLETEILSPGVIKELPAETQAPPGPETFEKPEIAPPLPEAIESEVKVPEEEPSLKIEEELATLTLGELYAKQGLYAEAIRVYQKILESDPENKEAQKRLEDMLLIKEGKIPPTLVEKEVKEEPTPLEAREGERESKGLEEVGLEELRILEQIGEKEKPVEETTPVKGPSELLPPEPGEAQESLDSLQAWLKSIRLAKSKEILPPEPKIETPQEETIVTPSSQVSDENRSLEGLRRWLSDVRSSSLAEGFKEESKTEGVSTAEERGEAKEEEKPREKVEMGQILANLERMDGVIGTILLQRSGGTKFESLKFQIDEQTKKTIADLFGLTERLESIVGEGVLQLDLVETTEGNLFLVNAGENLLVVLTEGNIPLGLIRLEAKKAAERIKGV